jgi:aminopeptidase
MIDHRIKNLAKTLVHYCTEVKEKEQVMILAQPPATPLVGEVYREALKCGAYPYLLPLADPFPAPGYEGLAEILYSEASDDQLQHIDPFYELSVKEFDVRILIYGKFNTKPLEGIDPERIKLRKQAYSGIFDTYFRRSNSRELKRVNTLFPTPAQAEVAGMMFDDYVDYVYRATFSDCEDPVREWMRIRDEQQVLVDWLNGRNELVVKGPNVDLSLSIKDRVFINSDGRTNMPSGEIFTGPVEDSVNGWIRSSFPAIYMGQEVSGIELHFKDGKVIKATAEENDRLLQSVLETDEGSRYLGEFAVGTNERIDRIIKQILFDEKIGGTIHMALGKGYPMTGSKNDSAIHWDILCDMKDGGQIFVDGDLFYDSGNFII